MRRFAILLTTALVLCLAAQGVAQDGDEAPAEGQGLKAVRYGEIELDGPILETLPDLYLLKPGIDTLYEVLQRFEKAREDEELTGIILRMRGIGVGWAKGQELRRAILKCRASGKNVICFLENTGNLEYYIASASDRVVMVPSGTLVLVGLRAEVLFFKGLLDKIGVKGDMLQVGDAKGAAEPFLQTTSSEPFRKSIEALLDDYHRQLVSGVASGRKLDEGRVQEIIDGGPYSATGAQKAGLVDDLMFYDELTDELRGKEPGPFRLVKDYGKAPLAPLTMTAGPQQLMRMMMGVGAKAPGSDFPKGPTIAVLYAVGPIMREEPDDLMLMGEFVVSAERMSRVIRKLREKDNVKAIVLRIDSPGGSAEASDLIWHELRLANDAKPVIVSMSDIAGSGGYYIAAGGRFIFAEEGTITGSIGVVGGKIVLKGLFDKIGLSVDVFERGKNAGLFSSIQEFSPEERARFGALLQETHELFIQRIQTSRKQPEAQLKAMAHGQSVTGFQAKEGGLVDAIGGLEEAIDAAKKAAGIAPEVEVAIVHLPRPQSVWEVVLMGRYDGVRAPRLMPAGSLPPALRPAASYLYTLLCLEPYRPATLMPFHLTVK